MKIKTKILFIVGCLLATFTFGQLDSYNYKIPLSNINGQWHKIELSDAIFNNINQNMHDIRIYGITANDTVEAPYVWKISALKNEKKTINFKSLNTSSNTKGYYFTYEIPTNKTINQIKLAFKNDNFDWKLTLEGSQHQNEWYTILRDYRILSIKNQQTNYAFTDINFPASKYRYYRLHIATKEKPIIQNVTITIDNKSTAQYHNYPITYLDIKEENKQTVLDIDFKRRLPLSYLKLAITDEIDYYRPCTIQYLADSVKTAKGWRYQYRNLRNETLHSLEESAFHFPTTITQKLRLTIHNDDNEPLTIEGATAKGYKHTLIARFNKPATYYLVYGNKNGQKPQYDITHGISKIPSTISQLKLGATQPIEKKPPPTTTPLFENKMWLWLIMVAVIVVLGGFTLQMMQKR